jgi:Asp-tRNA(Asn)/Glu-tRNA(Gln) amidotransferase C subunit
MVSRGVSILLDNDKLKQLQSNIDNLNHLKVEFEEDKKFMRALGKIKNYIETDDLFE